MSLPRVADNERRWLERIRLWQQSQLTIRAFCRRQRLTEPSFYFWRRVLRQRGLLDADRATAPPAFVQVAVAAAPPAPTPLDLVLASGRTLRLRPGFDPDTLRHQLRLLEEPSC
jgi:hypothetical protein